MRKAESYKPLTPPGESPDQWYERERNAFIAWWESEGQKKFGETPTLAAGAGWLARADALRTASESGEKVIGADIKAVIDAWTPPSAQSAEQFCIGLTPERVEQIAGAYFADPAKREWCIAAINKALREDRPEVERKRTASSGAVAPNEKTRCANSGSGTATAGDDLAAERIICEGLMIEQGEGTPVSRADSLRILRARLSEHLSPAEVRDLEDAACTLDKYKSTSAPSSEAVASQERYCSTCERNTSRWPCNFTHCPLQPTTSAGETSEERRLRRRLEKIDAALDELGAPKHEQVDGLTMELSRVGRIKRLGTAPAAGVAVEPVAWTTQLALDCVAKNQLGFDVSPVNMWGERGVPLYAGRLPSARGATLTAEWCVDAFWRVNPGRNATVPSLYLLDFAREVLRVYGATNHTDSWSRP